MLFSSCWRLLPHLPVTSILPPIFPSIMCFRRQFLRKLWPIQFAFLRSTVRRISLYSLTPCKTSSVLTRSVQLIFSILFLRLISRLLSNSHVTIWMLLFLLCDTVLLGRSKPTFRRNIPSKMSVGLRQSLPPCTQGDVPEHLPTSNQGHQFCSAAVVFNQTYFALAQTRSAQIPSASSPSRLNIVLWCLILVGPQYRSSLMSNFWRMEFCGCC
jgi:hypothetical protein